MTYTPNFHMNSFVVLWFICFAVILAIALFIIISKLSESLRNNRAPEQSTEATAVNSRISVSGGPNTGHFTSYYVTFQFADGTRRELNVPAKDYGLIAVGDKGLLTYKGTKFIFFERR